MRTTGLRSLLLCTDFCISPSPRSTLVFHRLRRNSASDFLLPADRLQISVVSKSLRMSSSLRPLPYMRTASVTAEHSFRLCASLPERCRVHEGLERRTMTLSSPKPPCTAASCSRSPINVERCTWQAIYGGEWRFLPEAKRMLRTCVDCPTIESISLMIIISSTVMASVCLSVCKERFESQMLAWTHLSRWSFLWRY